MKKRRLIALTFICLAWVALLYVVYAATESNIEGASDQIWISGILKYSYGGKNYTTESSLSEKGASVSVEINGNTLIGKATSSTYYDEKDPKCSQSRLYHYAGTVTNTITVTNISTYPIKINKLTVTGAEIQGVTQGATLPSGAQFTITITAAPASKDDKTSKSTTGSVTIDAEEVANVDITAMSSAYASYSIEGHTVAQNGEDISFLAKVGSTISLPVVAVPAGYKFIGWRIDGSIVDANSLTVTTACMVYPVILSESTDISLPVFKVGNQSFHFWDDAMNAAVTGSDKTVALMVDHTLPDTMDGNTLPARGNGTYIKNDGEGHPVYLLPVNVTLLVPYDSGYTLNTDEIGASATYTAPTEFRRLTLPAEASMIVNGAISVNSKIHAASGGQSTCGAPTGSYGRMELEARSTITVDGSGAIYAYGFITGGGTITANEGTTVHECMQMAEFGGGAKLYCMNKGSGSGTYKAFPFSQYYVQNIECSLTFAYGAKEILHTALCANQNTIYTKDDVAFIGTTSGLFLMSNGCTVTKRYLSGEDRMEVIIDGSAELGSINISLMSYTFASSNFVLPITGSLYIHVASGNMSIKNDTEFIPGSKLQIDKGASVTVASGKKLFVYDATQWLKATNGAGVGTVTDKAGNREAPDALEGVSGYGFVQGNKDLQPAAYSPTRVYNRTSDNMADAEIDVNGKLIIEGYLNTTSSGARIISSQGSGTIDMGDVSVQNLYQFTNNGNSSTIPGISAISGYVYYYHVKTTSAQLKNGDAYEGTADEYLKTADCGTGLYRYEPVSQRWYKYKVEYQFGESTIYTDYIGGSTSEYTPGGIQVTGANSSVGNATFADNTVTVTGITADCTVWLSGDAEQFVPYFVLNEKQYGLYQRFTGKTATKTETIDEQTYYVVSTPDTFMDMNAELSAPADADMGVSAASENSITWRLSDSKVGVLFAGRVPEGSEGKAYIYGSYSGYVAAVTVGGVTTKYATLEEAFSALPEAGTATVTMVSNCGTFEDEDKVAQLTVPAAATVTFDIAGYEAWGSVLNNGAMTIDLKGGRLVRDNAAEQLSATQTVFNLGTMTIQDSATGGEISNNSWRAVSGAIVFNAEYYQAVVRNAGENAFLVIKEGVNLVQSETGLVPTDNKEDNFTAVGIVNVNGATITDTKANISVPNGAAVYNCSGLIKSISGGQIGAKQGIYNRNMRTAAGATSATGYEVPFVATIESIGGNAQINVTQYAVHNRALIKAIEGNAQLKAASNTIYVRGDQWYFDTSLKTRTYDSSSPYTRTDIYDTGILGTIKLITGSVKITATSECGINIINGGLLEELSGSAEISAGKNTVRVCGTRYKTCTYTYYDSARKQVNTQDVYYADASRIALISGNAKISATTGTYAILNYNVIDKITGNVVLTAYSGSTVGNLPNEWNQYTHWTSTNSAGDKPYDITKNYEYAQATIGEISNGVTINAGSSNKDTAILNRGKITTLSGITINARSHAIQSSSSATNASETICKSRQTICKYTSAGNSGEKDLSRTYYVPTITTIDGVTVNYTSYGIRNGGYIGTIQNSTISTTGGERAISNEGYVRTKLMNSYKWDGITATLESTNTEWTPCQIDLIGSGNVLQAKTNVIINYGTITSISGSTVTATSGVAVYNYRGLKTLDNGASYTNPTIGTIENTVIKSTSIGIQNGEGNATYGVATIDQIKSGTEVTSSGSNAVRNSNYAVLGKILGGVFTGKDYGLYNGNASSAIKVWGGDYKGTAESARANAICDPNNTALQTYKDDCTLSYDTHSVTLSNGSKVDGYYYLVLDQITIKFDGNGGAGSMEPLIVSTTTSPVTTRLPDNGFTRDETWKFIGWATDRNTAADSVNPGLMANQPVDLSLLGEDIHAGSEVTLYAIWKPNKSHSVTVSWNSDKLLYNYQPNVYEWNAQNLCYVLKTPAYWKGDHIVTITNAEGQSGNTKYGKVNVGINYTNTNTSYSGFSMKYYNPDTQVEFTGTDSSNNLAKALDPGGIVKAQMKLIGDLPTGMASGTNIKIGRVALTLTTAD